MRPQDGLPSSKYTPATGMVNQPRLRAEGGFSKRSLGGALAILKMGRIPCPLRCQQLTSCKP